MGRCKEFFRLFGFLIKRDLQFQYLLLLIVVEFFSGIFAKNAVGEDEEEEEEGGTQAKTKNSIGGKRAKKGQKREAKG